jgi:hypothetical protein
VAATDPGVERQAGSDHLRPLEGAGHEPSALELHLVTDDTEP